MGCWERWLAAMARKGLVQGRRRRRQGGVPGSERESAPTTPAAHRDKRAPRERQQRIHLRAERPGCAVVYIAKREAVEATDSPTPRLPQERHKPATLRKFGARVAHTGLQVQEGFLRASLFWAHSHVHTQNFSPTPLFAPRLQRRGPRP